MKLVVAVIPMALFAAGCDCMYGGAGCGDPAMFGLCSRDGLVAEVPVGTSTPTIDYGDDTGEHPVPYGRVVAVPSDRLTASISTTVGEVVLVGLTPGPAELRFTDVLGWEGKTFYFNVNVVAGTADATCIETSYLSPEQP